MKNVNDFKEKLVKIEYVESSGCYGVYPFPAFVETKEGETELLSLAFGGNSRLVYDVIQKKLNEGSKRIYFALDFPTILDIDKDFVVVISISNKLEEAFAIPYDNATGETFEIIRESEILNNIIKQTKDVLKIN